MLKHKILDHLIGVYVQQALTDVASDRHCKLFLRKARNELISPIQELTEKKREKLADATDEEVLELFGRAAASLECMVLDKNLTAYKIARWMATYLE